MPKIGFKSREEAEEFAQEKIDQLRNAASKVGTPPSVKNNGFNAKEIQGYLVDKTGKKLVDCIEGCSVLILQDAYIKCNKNGLSYSNDHCSSGFSSYVLRDVIGSIDWEVDSASDL